MDMMPQWHARPNGALAARFAEASEAVAATLRDAEHAFTRRGGAGLEAARAFGKDALGGARHLERSTRTLIAERPFEMLLVMGITGFAIGWIARHARDLRARRPVAARATSRARARA